MEKKDIQKLLDKQTADIEGHIDVLVEDFDEKVKIIAEQHLTTMQVLQEHTRQIKDIQERIIGMDIKLDRIDTNLQKKVDYEDFRNLVKRVTLLESRVGRKA